MVWARSNAKSIIQTVLKDTLGGISGKIIDSLTNAPIPFATISFYKEGAGTMTIVSNEKGEFSIDVKQARSKLQLSAIGYQEHSCYLDLGHNNLLRLTPVSNLLPNVIVSGKAPKKPNADGIIKKVNKQIEQNYGGLSFDQKFEVHSTTHNYDTLKNETTDLINLLFFSDKKSLQVKNWPQHKENRDTVFFKFIGVPELSAGYIAGIGDVIRRGKLIVGEKGSKNFDFRLLSHYKDKKNGNKYLVSFKGDTFENMWVGHVKGEMLIREDDYAVESVKYTWELQDARRNKSTEESYHSRNWKAFSVTKIIADSTIFKYEYSYVKDTVTGKYFVQTMKADCKQTGYQVENHRKVQLYYTFDAASLGIENIQNELGEKIAVVQTEGQKKGSN